MYTLPSLNEWYGLGSYQICYNFFLFVQHDTTKIIQNNIASLNGQFGLIQRIQLCDLESWWNMHYTLIFSHLSVSGNQVLSFFLIFFCQATISVSIFKYSTFLTSLESVRQCQPNLVQKIIGWRLSNLIKGREDYLEIFKIV